MKPAILRPLAQADREHELRYYRRQANAAVAARLVEAMADALAQIQRQPGIGSPRLAHELALDGLLGWTVKGFPLAWCHFERADRLGVVRLLGEWQDAHAWLADAASHG